MGYDDFFLEHTGVKPFAYQAEVARLLFDSRNVVVRAPTGAGKTWAVLVPFLFDAWKHRPSKLIYVLPLRTLAESIYREAQELLAKTDLGPEKVTMQTGEQPDDPFLDRGRVVITTYDQLLSGLLETPYGLPDRLHNVNAASIVGALVVFDEFHLMEPQRAFMSSLALLKMFEGLCQSVWMTATATQSLVQQLESALEAAVVPGNDTKWAALLDALPSVNSVKRSFAMKLNPLTARHIVAAHQTTSLVILNTVDRAQKLYEELEEELRASSLDAELIQLHARFFRSHRRDKEARLRELFGKAPKRSAILIATQVIEAGVDVSCEDLHTELCPINALVQRAGRCARYPGQSGTVHIYPLPDEPRSWLPYGTLKEPVGTLTRTWDLLSSVIETRLDPAITAEWVQQIHSAEDAEALRDGLQQRIGKCKDVIERRAVLRQHDGVAELIRQPDTDQIRTVICDSDHLPDSPAKREAVAVSRWRLMHLVEELPAVGWRWDWTNANEPWQPLRAPADLWSAFIVCLNPAAADYDRDRGLTLGRVGAQYSPFRVPPRRPGYPQGPLVREPWTEHARNVARESQERVSKEAADGSLLAFGLRSRYGLSFDNLLDAASAAGLLHDLGKLQDAWQGWAEAAQKSKDPDYLHAVPLAHTDFDRDNRDDVERERSLGINRPQHAAASCYYGAGIIGRMLPQVPGRRELASAILAAVVAHHGGWWRSNFEAPAMWPDWTVYAAEVLGHEIDTNDFGRLQTQAVTDLLDASTGPDSLSDYWPLVAYLTRTLRLADQRATAESGASE